MKTYILPIAIGTVVVLGLAARPAAAQTVYYTSDDTINSTINYGYVGYASYANIQSSTNPSSPTVALVPGGLVKDQNASGDLNVYNYSTLNMSGGGVNYNMFLNDTATLNLSGGTIGSGYGGALSVYGSSKANISGGTVGVRDSTSGLYVYGGSAASISGGTIKFVSGYDNSTMTITGGSFVQNNSHGATFYDDTSGAFTFVGTGLSATLLGYDSYFQGNKYLLAGILQGGQDITGDIIAVAGGARMFTLAPSPEPSEFVAFAVGLLGLSALALKARKRTASHRSGTATSSPVS